MHAIKAVYDGKSFTPTQPIPVEGRYDVIITFVEPAELSEPKKKNPRAVLDFCGIFDEDTIDLEEIYEERKNFSIGRPDVDDLF